MSTADEYNGTLSLKVLQEIACALDFRVLDKDDPTGVEIQDLRNPGRVLPLGLAALHPGPGGRLKQATIDQIHAFVAGRA